MKNKKSLFFLYLIIIMALYLRLFNYSSTLNMDTDQGAALLIADRIINHGHILLVGPLTSVWQINLLPPVYYYLIAALFFLFKNEIAVSLTFTFANILTIILLYLTGKLLFNSKTGLVAALYMAVSETMVWYGRNFWEPYLVPFFITLSIYLLFLARSKKNIKFYLLSVLIFFVSFLYVSTIIILPAYFYFSYQVLKEIKPSMKYHLVNSFGLFLTTAVLFYLPVIYFEITHNSPSLNYIFALFKGNTNYINYNIAVSFSSLIKHIQLLLNSFFISVRSKYIGFIIFIFIFTVNQAWRIAKKEKVSFRFLVILLFSIIFTGIYSSKAEVFRMASVYPSVFLIFGFLTVFFSRHVPKLRYLIFFRLLIFSTITLYLINNFKALSSIAYPSRKIRYLESYFVASEIINNSKNQDFTIYIVTPDDKTNHHSTVYWWALEKITGKKLVNLNASGNWIIQDLDRNKSEVFLICKGFQNHSLAETECLNNFREEFKINALSYGFTTGTTYTFNMPL